MTPEQRKEKIVDICMSIMHFWLDHPNLTLLAALKEWEKSYDHKRPHN
jgi:hypothetical protein